MLEAREDLQGKTLELERLLASEWRALPSSERAPHEQDEARDQERYQEERAAYLARQAAPPVPLARPDTSEAAETSPKAVLDSQNVELQPLDLRCTPPQQQGLTQASSGKIKRENSLASREVPSKKRCHAFAQVSTDEAEEVPPKRAATAFACFARARRAALPLEGRPAELEKMLVAEWKAMDAEGRAAFEEEEARDRARYEAEMAAFRMKKSQGVTPTEIGRARVRGRG